jgi:hypothetical protein
VPSRAQPVPDTAATAEPAVKIVVPAATSISIRTVDPIDSKADRVGQEFMAKLADAVKVRDRDVFHADDVARLRLGESASEGHSGKAEPVLELVSITSGGQSYAVSAAPFLIKGGFLRKKKVAAGTQIEFTLSAPVTFR